MLVSAQELTLVLSLASEPADFMQKYICNEFWSTKLCVGCLQFTLSHFSSGFMQSLN